MNQAATTFGYQTHWPDAIVVYPQGLIEGPPLKKDGKKKAIWQTHLCDRSDCDLKFFDVMLASFKEDYNLDTKRIYVMGHGSGGAFAYLLWETRGENFAAVAATATIGGLKHLVNLKPKPVLHIAGQRDTVAQFEWQKFLIDGLLKLNRCSEGRRWADVCTYYDSTIGAPVVVYIHPGRHEFPPDAGAIIVRFFKEHAKP